MVSKNLGPSLVRSLSDVALAEYLDALARVIEIQGRVIGRLEQEVQTKAADRNETERGRLLAQQALTLLRPLHETALSLTTGDQPDEHDCADHNTVAVAEDRDVCLCTEFAALRRVLLRI